MSRKKTSSTCEGYSNPRLHWDVCHCWIFWIAQFLVNCKLHCLDTCPFTVTLEDGVERDGHVTKLLQQGPATPGVMSGTESFMSERAVFPDTNGIESPKVQSTRSSNEVPPSPGTPNRDGSQSHPSRRSLEKPAFEQVVIRKLTTNFDRKHHEDSGYTCKANDHGDIMLHVDRGWYTACENEVIEGTVYLRVGLFSSFLSFSRCCVYMLWYLQYCCGKHQCNASYIRSE